MKINITIIVVILTTAGLGYYFTFTIFETVIQIVYVKR